ncbi:MAG: fatty acid hydroxylase [Candidatus Taylorbacteria bacterium]|nr:fatty acid hydroxylase [Candidatus Taylorbacteria bacterium]
MTTIPTLDIFYYVILVLTIIAYTSIFEWILHKYIMHKPLGKFDYPFKAHAIVHHGLFKADETYHLTSHENQADRKTIPMAWWNALILVPLAALPFTFLSLFDTWVLATTAVTIIALYYGTYEYIHWCMHLPKNRQFECWDLFRRLNGHHVLHHRYMHKNFNVVLPFADWCFGTLLKRSPIVFNQVRGLSVPNLQPQTGNNWKCM